MENKCYRKQMVFESLEPRLLFSAGPESLLAADALMPEAVVDQSTLEQPVASDPDTLTPDYNQLEDETRQELVIVDLATPDYQALVDDLLSGQGDERRVDIVYLDQGRDGIEQISNILSGYHDLDAVHIVSHGDQQTLQLGDSALQIDTLASYRAAIGNWSNAFNTEADLLLYGCNLAGSDAGVALINALGKLTGTDVAASDDLTGGWQSGGDWDLEYHFGDIETGIAFSSELQDSWTGLLATTTAGSEFQVNATSADNQQNSAVATDTSGNFVVVWESSNQDGDGSGIYAQRYDAAGNAVGTEFRVNTTTTDDQSDPAVAMDAGGGFVVVWESSNQDGDGSGIYARRYDAAGNAVGTEFRVNTTTAADQSSPDITMGAGGDFVVVWTSDNQDGDKTGIFSQRYDAAGNAVGSEIQINAYTTGRQENPAVAMDATGRLVVTWDSLGQDGSSWGIFARLLDDTGTPLTGDMQVNETTNGIQQFSDVAMDADGDFVVVWEGSGTGDNAGIFARLYDSSGTAKGAEFLVNTTTGNTQSHAAVAMDAGGSFVVVWSSNNQDGDVTGVYGQQYDAAGNTIGGEFLVNTNTLFDQKNPAIALYGPDDFVIVWQSNHQDAGSTWDVYGKHYTHINIDPVIGLPGGPVNYTENAVPVIIDAGATVADPDSADFDGGILTVDLTAGGTLDDRLAIRNEGTAAGQIGIAGSDVTYGGIVIGTFAGGGDGMTALVITLNASADLAAVQALLRNISFQNVSENPNTGNRTVRFVLTDGDGGTSNTVTETITVIAANDSPVAGDITLNADEDGPPVSGAFSVSDPDSADTHNFTITGAPAGGSVTNNGDGTFTFDPGSAFQDLAAGETRTVSFTYNATDDSGAANNTSNTATVTISVTGNNDAPVATDDGPVVTGEGQGITINLAVNDTDIDDGIDPASLAITGGPAFGSVLVNADGSVVYTHDGSENFTDSFTYNVRDLSGAVSNSATVYINISPGNDTPVAGDDIYSLDEDSVISGNVMVNDTDVDLDVLAASLVSGTNDGNLIFSSDGSFTYTPDANFNGTDSFTYQIDDGNGGIDTATVTLTVTPVNDAPTANDDNYALDENNILGTGSPGVLSNDSDVDGDPLFATLVSGPVHGTLVLNADGSFTYTPDAGFTGTDSFIYLANDSSNSAMATVNLTINPVTPPLPDSDNDPGDELPDDKIKNVENLPVSIESVTGIRSPFLVTGEDRTQDISLDIHGSDSLHTTADRDAKERQTYDISSRQNLLSAMKLLSSENSGLWQMIDLMKDQMGDRLGGNQNLLELLAKSATGMTLTLSAGFVTWALRGGSVLASMLSSMPLWKGFDPLPIIDSARKEMEGRAGRTDADDSNTSERVAEELLDAVGTTDHGTHDD